MNSFESIDLGVTLRKPVPEDGFLVSELVKSSPPLDTNSLYCNLLQCSYFADTCVAACSPDGSLLGFVSAYIVPGRPDTLFVWQVAVSDAARGKGLAGRMLVHLLKRVECIHVVKLETTITDSNSASWGLFRSLAKLLEAELTSQILFDKQQHFGGQQASEVLVTLSSFDGKTSTNL